MIAYKLFRINPKEKGKIFPLYVNYFKETKIGVWLEAESGELLDNGKVKSRLGPLAYRPGWHLSDYPIATHIGIKNNKGEIEFIKPYNIWCECEYSIDINYQEEANKRGINKKGILIPRNAFLNYIPENGFYRYKTNPLMLGDWIIAGKIKINRILTDKEVRNILINNSLKPMERFGGDINLKDYDLDKFN